MLKEKCMLTSRNVAELQSTQEDCKNRKEMKTAREVSIILGVSKRTLQYYNEIGLISPSRVDKSTGYWKYSDARIEKLKEIIALRDLNFTLKEIKSIVSDPEVDISEIMRIKIEEMQREKHALEEKIKTAKRIRELGCEKLSDICRISNE